jgi:hypothetical protein
MRWQGRHTRSPEIPGRTGFGATEIQGGLFMVKMTAVNPPLKTLAHASVTRAKR